MNHYSSICLFGEPFDLFNLYFLSVSYYHVMSLIVSPFVKNVRMDPNAIHMSYSTYVPPTYLISTKPFLEREHIPITPSSVSVPHTPSLVTRLSDDTPKVIVSKMIDTVLKVNNLQPSAMALPEPLPKPKLTCSKDKKHPNKFRLRNLRREAAYKAHGLYSSADGHATYRKAFHSSSRWCDICSQSSKGMCDRCRLSLVGRLTLPTILPMETLWPLGPAQGPHEQPIITQESLPLETQKTLTATWNVDMDIQSAETPLDTPVFEPFSREDIDDIYQALLVPVVPKGGPIVFVQAPEEQPECSSFSLSLDRIREMRVMCC
jgi:hypothetical protein